MYLTSPYYQAGDAGVQQDVSVYRTTRGAARAFEALGSRAMHRCVVPELRRQIGIAAEAVVGDVTVIRTESSGPDEQATRSTAAGSNDVQPFTVFIDNVRHRVGRGVSSLTLVSSFSPIGEALYERVVKGADERLANAFG